VKTFIVEIPEVWYASWRVNAEKKKDAVEKAFNGDGDETDFTYSDRLGRPRVTEVANGR